MTRILSILTIVLFVVMSAAKAQEFVPAIPPQAGVALPADLPPPANPPQFPAPWAHERAMQNQQGIGLNRRGDVNVPANGYGARERAVTNSDGEMTQSRLRINAEQGYQYHHSQTWTNPDGSLPRGSQQTLSGLDPHNYTRERNHTLRDGRTINQTQVRSWDGTRGTQERSFTGPNGQTHQSQTSWTPAEPSARQVPSLPELRQPATVRPTVASPTSRTAEKVSWWQKLNPFRRQASETTRSTATSAPRRGFTIGTPGRNASSTSALGSRVHPSVQGSQNAHRPSWAGGVPRSMSPQGPPAHASRPAAASRPSPGRGPNR